MAPMRRLVLGLACCMATMATTTVSADTPAPVLISGAPGGGANSAPAPAPLLFTNSALIGDAGVVRPGALGDKKDPAIAIRDGSTEDEPVFLPGVFLPEENILTAGNATTPSSAPPTPTPTLTPTPTPTSTPTSTPRPSNATTNAPGTAAAPPTANVLGGWPSMPAGNTEIAFLVNVLSNVKYYDASLSFGVCFKNIFSLQYQSVAGTNFRYSGNGCLVQKGSKLMGACTSECAFEKIMVTIFTQDWTNTVQVKGITYIQ